MKKEKHIYLLLIGMATALFVFEFNVDHDESNAYCELQAESIKSISVNTTSNVYLKYSEIPELHVEGDIDLVKNLKILQKGSNLEVQMKEIYNPLKLIRLAYASSRPINIYISGPNAKSITINNRENFAVSNMYENGSSKMMILKNPRLFSKINLRSATCSVLKTSNIM